MKGVNPRFLSAAAYCTAAILTRSVYFKLLSSIYRCSRVRDERTLQSALEEPGWPWRIIVITRRYDLGDRSWYSHQYTCFYEPVWVPISHRAIIKDSFWDRWSWHSIWITPPTHKIWRQLQTSCCMTSCSDSYPILCVSVYPFSAHAMIGVAPHFYRHTFFSAHAMIGLVLHFYHGIPFFRRTLW